MPRPSMAAQRKEEILDAFERCILEDSLEATSLEKLAEQANMKRSILRHYIGNRNEIIVALSERYQQYYRDLWRLTLSELPDDDRLHTLIHFLFEPRDQDYINKSIIGEAIHAQAKHLDTVREHQINADQHSVDIIKSELKKAFPKADLQKVSLVARGILASYVSSESLLPLGQPQEIEQLKQVCYLLIETLDNSTN